MVAGIGLLCACVRACVLCVDRQRQRIVYLFCLVLGWIATRLHAYMCYDLLDIERHLFRILSD